MKSLHLIKIWVLAGLAFVACEKVIEVPLNEAEQVVVAEVVLKDGVGNNYAFLSKSGSVYKDDDFEKITDAAIVVTDQDGDNFVMSHQGEGVYNNAEFEVIPGYKYDLKIEVEGQVFTASSQTRSKPSIDSLTYYPISGAFGVPEEDTIYLVAFHSVDNVEESNFYWLTIYRNGKPNSGYYLGNDKFINGQYYTAQFFGSEADPGDTVFVEMVSMDEPTYSYFIGLSNSLTSSPFAAAPANPPTNFKEKGIVGYFGAFSTDTMSVIIPG